MNTKEGFDGMALCGKRIQSLRERTGRNRKVTSELCGLSSNALSRYERGEVIPDLESLIKIADYFDVSMDYLCGRK